MDFAALLAAADRAALKHAGGETVRYSSSALDGESFVDPIGMFDDVDKDATAEGTTVMSSGPQVFIRLEDLVLPDGTQLDPDTDDDPTVTRGGVVYRVRDIKRDGQGGVTLFLAVRPTP